MVFLPGLGWILFAFGGTQISDKIGGKKWIRRFVLPLILFVGCMTVSTVWQSLGVMVLAMAAFHLGYGDGKSWAGRAIVGVAYGFIGAPVGLSVWNLVTALGFISLFWLSNQKATARTFTWKICEGTFGALVGIEIAYSLMGYGLHW